MQRVDDIVAAFAAIVRPEIRRDHTIDSCVASTWITVEVMRHFQISGRALTVKAEICNAAFASFERENGRRPFLGESAESWIVGIGFRQEPGCVGTHVVALVDERLLVDPSIDQGNAPERGIELPGVVWAEIDQSFFAGRSLTLNILGQRLIYVLHDARIDLNSFYDFNHNPETDAAVERTVAKLESLGFRPLENRFEKVEH